MNSTKVKVKAFKNINIMSKILENKDIMFKILQDVDNCLSWELVGCLFPRGTFAWVPKKNVPENMPLELLFREALYLCSKNYNTLLLQTTSVAGFPLTVAVTKYDLSSFFVYHPVWIVNRCVPDPECPYLFLELEPSPSAPSVSNEQDLYELLSKSKYDFPPFA